MNTIQRQALTECHSKILKDLDLDADLAGKLIHHGVFNEDMIEDFKSETTRRRQVQKMLFKLPRRGPRAFELFTLTLQEHYSWLADSLKDAHNKISYRKDSDHITAREKADIFVHEHFGNSKRFCEEDKKQIKKFLYKHLKETDDNNTHLENSQYSQEEQMQLEKEIESRLYQRVLSIIDKDSSYEDSDTDSVDSFDEPKEYTIDMIEAKVKEKNERIENLEQEIEKCLNVLGLKDCDYPLHDVLETYTEKRNQELEELVVLKEKLAVLEKRNNKLQEKLYHKEYELKEKLQRLKHDQESLEDLQAENVRLKRANEKHMEKQQTLMTLKNIVNDLSPIQKQRPDLSVLHKDSYDEPDGQADTLHLPQIVDPRNSRTKLHRHSNASKSRERASLNHHEFPAATGRPLTGKPWK